MKDDEELSLATLQKISKKRKYKNIVHILKASYE